MKSRKIIRHWGLWGVLLSSALALVAPVAAQPEESEFAKTKSRCERQRAEEIKSFWRTQEAIDASEISEYDKEVELSEAYERMRRWLIDFQISKSVSYKEKLMGLEDDKFREEILQAYKDDAQARGPIGDYIKEAGYLKRSAETEQKGIQAEIDRAQKEDVKKQREQELADSKASFAQRLAQAKEKLIDRLVQQQMDRALVNDYAGDPEAQAMVRDYIGTRDESEQIFKEELEEYGEEESYAKRRRREEQEEERKHASRRLRERLREHKKKLGLAPKELFGGYAEGYLAFAGNTASSMNIGISTCTASGNVPLRGKMDPSVLGGGRLGCWFGSKLGEYFPSWGKYFGFYTDFSFQRLNFARQSVANAPVPGVATTFSSEGTAATWSFMFAGRLGFLPDREVPFGRVQPYVAVGPGLMFTSQNPTFRLQPGDTVEPGSQSDVAVCLVVDAGVRYMALRNVSVNVFFKYRFAEPSFDYTFFDRHIGVRRSFTLSPTFHLFSGHVGVAYHF